MGLGQSPEGNDFINVCSMSDSAELPSLVSSPEPMAHRQASVVRRRL